MNKIYQKKPLPKARPLTPGLNSRGHEVNDGESMTNSLGLRPPTLQEQIARLTAGNVLAHFLPDEDRKWDDDNWDDHLDDLPDEGLTPHEIAALPKKAAKKVVEKQKASSATPPDGSTPPSGDPKTSQEGGV